MKRWWLISLPQGFHLPPGDSQVLQKRKGLISPWVHHGEERPGLALGLGSDLLCDYPAFSGHQLTHLLKEILGKENAGDWFGDMVFRKLWAVACSRTVLCLVSHICDVLNPYRNTWRWYYHVHFVVGEIAVHRQWLSKIKLLRPEPRSLNNLSSFNADLGYGYLTSSESQSGPLETIKISCLPDR